MKPIFQFFKTLFLTKQLFAGLAISSVFYLFSFFFPWLGILPSLFFWSLIALLLLDILLLYRLKNGIFATREAPERLSNSDDNEIGIYVESFYPFKVKAGIIDELPAQFQKRDLWIKASLVSRQNKIINYIVRPTKRGEYEFGNIHVYVQSPLQLIRRRYTFQQTTILPVYPSFLQMRKYELMAISNRLTDVGIKKIRRLGHSLEFEQIKNYVAGDDYRSVNWKASARKGELMVNAFTDEKAQHVYNIIDKSRAMKMPFDGLSLLDYAVNASLVLSNVALLKEDKAGLITVSKKIGAVVKADRKPMHLNKIMEVLYKEKSGFLETNMEALYIAIRSNIKQRSLLIFYTNFESLSAMQRQLPVLKRIAKFHLLLVVFFENTELKALSNSPANNVEEIYVQTVAAKFAYEKKQIVKELTRNGIQSILTSPKNLTVNSVNKYLEIKARQSI